MLQKNNVKLVDHTVTINRPIGEVYDYILNHENYAYWYPGVVEVTSANDLPYESTGKLYDEIIKLPSGRKKLIRIKVCEVVSPHFFMTQGDLAPLHPQMEIRLKASADEITSLNLKFFSRSQSLVGRLVAGILFRPAMYRQSQSGLSRLKTILETQKTRAFVEGNAGH